MARRTIAVTIRFEPKHSASEALIQAYGVVLPVDRARIDRQQPESDEEQREKPCREAAG